jgi:hypothetical protein
MAFIIWKKGKLQILAQRRRDAEMKKKKSCSCFALKLRASAPLREIFYGFAF